MNHINVSICHSEKGTSGSNSCFCIGLNCHVANRDFKARHTKNSFKFKLLQCQTIIQKRPFKAPESTAALLQCKISAVNIAVFAAPRDIAAQWFSTHLDGAQTGARFQGVNRPKTRPNQILVGLWLSDAIIKIVELQLVIRCRSIKIVFILQ